MSKTIFTANFTGNISEFYNFVGNNYPQKNYLSIKIPRQNNKKNLFLQNFIINLQEKFHKIWEFIVLWLNVYWYTFFLYIHL